MVPVQPRELVTNPNSLDLGPGRDPSPNQRPVHHHDREAERDRIRERSLLAATTTVIGPRVKRPARMIVNVDVNDTGDLVATTDMMTSPPIMIAEPAHALLNPLEDRPAGAKGTAIEEAAVGRTAPGATAAEPAVPAVTAMWTALHLFPKKTASVHATKRHNLARRWNHQAAAIDPAGSAQAAATMNGTGSETATPGDGSANELATTNGVNATNIEIVAIVTETGSARVGTAPNPPTTATAHPGIVPGVSSAAGTTTETEHLINRPPNKPNQKRTLIPSNVKRATANASRRSNSGAKPSIPTTDRVGSGIVAR